MQGTPARGLTPLAALCAMAPGLRRGAARDALEGKVPHRRPQKRLDRRLEEVAKAVGGGYCRLQMPLSLALAIGETVAGRRLGALEGGGGLPPPLPMHPWVPPPVSAPTGDP